MRGHLRWLALAAAVMAGLWLTMPAANALPLALAHGHTAAAPASGGTAAPGPYEPGNLLNYADSDFESSSGVGDWVAVSNAALSQGGQNSYLHNHSLKDTIGTAGQDSVFKVGGDTKVTVTAGDTYTVGSYFKVPTTCPCGRTVTFGLGFYNSQDTWLGWGNTQPLTLNLTAGWQYVAGTITAPTGAAYVLDSPEVTYSRAATNNEVFFMDEVAFTPRRSAQMIGAYAADWVGANDPSNIGPLQSSKEFFSGPPNGDLPTAFSDTVCAGIETSVAKPQWPACIIAYKNLATQAAISQFVTSIPPAQMVIMVFCQEPEGNNGTADCYNNDGQTGPHFVSAFNDQSQKIRTAAGDDPNVFVAMDAEAYQYADVGSGHSNGTDCSYIPPASSTDMYLVDHYESISNPNGATNPGHNLPNSGGDSAAEWNNWLSCVSPSGVPIGLAEYGLNQNLGTANIDAALSADHPYLAGLQANGSINAPFLLWEYWWSGGDQFTDAKTKAEWQSFETQNGGGS